MNPEYCPDARKDLLAALCITVLACLIYATTYHVPWYFDDGVNITANQMVHSLGESFAKIVSPRGPALLSFALNYAIHGESLFGYHLVNTLFHIVTTFLVYLILKRAVNRWALAGALLFLSHPLQTQAVTYIVQRMTLLCALFLFLSLYSFIRARESLEAGDTIRTPRHVVWYLLMLVTAFLSIITKQNAAFLPVGLFLFDYFFISSVRGWSNRRRCIYLLPVVAPVAAVVAVYFFKPLVTGTSLTALSSFSAAISPGTYFVTELSVLWIYIRMLFLPYGQALDHGYPFADSYLTLQSGLAGVGLLLLMALAWRMRRTRPEISFAIAWFFASLAVESSFIPLDALFEHRLYVPMFGFALAVTAAIARIPSRGGRLWIIGVLILCYAVLSFQRNLLWVDPIAFYEDNLRKTPHNVRVHVELARCYMLAKRHTAAERLLNRAVELAPASADAFVYLGTLYDETGRQEDAIAAYKKAIAFQPSLVKAYVELAVVYSKRKEYAVAEELLRRVIATQKPTASAYYNLGVVLYMQKKNDAARDAFRSAVTLAPYDADALYNLGIVLAESGAYVEAETVVSRLAAFSASRGAELQAELQTLRKNGK